MKKSLVALALFGAFATVAQAQSSVVIYGALDANVGKTTNTTVSMGSSDNNKLGFKGVEDLGNGLKALFQLEMRYALDTGTNEAVTRPLFQGESRVGLQGAFGTVRLGRGLTALQASSGAFEPWSGRGNAAVGFQPDLQVAGFNTDPLNTGAVTASSKNRLSNALFYNSPVFSGFQANVTVGTKETGTAATTVTTPASLITNAAGVAIGINQATTVTTTVPAKTVPYSASATYNQGIVGAMLAYERNAIQDKLWSIAASATPITNLKLMASYQRANNAALTTPDQKSWILGANYTMGAGKFLAGYGQRKPSNTSTKLKQASVGYEYSLSPRTFVYAEASNKKTVSSVNYYGVGVHHNF